MVIDQGKVDCCNTEVGNFCYLTVHNCLYVHTATDNGSSLEKRQFARIIDGNLVYESGESDYTVYPG